MSGDQPDARRRRSPTREAVAAGAGEFEPRSTPDFRKQPNGARKEGFRIRTRFPFSLPLVAALLAAALLPATASAATTLAVEISNANANEAHFMRAFDAPSVAVADFDGDGDLELVAHNDNQYVYVMSSQDSHIYAEFRPDYPSGWTVRPLNEPKVADVDRDGKLDIIVVNSAAFVCVYEFEGRSGSSFDFEKEWCRRMDAFDGASAAADGGAAVANIDGEGNLEIFAQTEKRGLYAFEADGTVRWRHDRFGGNAGPTAVDIDADGKTEVIFASDGGTITSIEGDSGRIEWTFRAQDFVSPASVPVSGNVADIDGDGRGEYVFIAREATHCCTVEEFRKNHFGIFVLEHDGRLKWWRQPSWGNPLSYTHPILEDLDGDGRRDILAMDWNTIGHKPGDWERLGPANVFAYNRDGSLKWRTEVDNTWSNDDLALADADADGKLEVIAVGPKTTDGWRDGVWYIDAATGAKHQHFAISGWTPLRGPIAADFDRDGTVDWAVPMHTSSKGGAFRIYETDSPCRIPFGGWSVTNPCSGGPRAGSGGGGGGGGDGGTPPPPGDFDATFTPKNGNEWWIQVDVDATQSVSAVHVSIDDGAWRPLELKSWGDWAASYHAPEGRLVQFRATSGGGATDTSGCYRWTSGTPTDCAGDGGGGGDDGGSFDATFRNVRGNEWWVESDVDVSGGTLAGVDARVDGGPWVALSRTDWGSWARSMHAPSGSSVEFRARSTGGSTDQSGTFTWPPG